MRLRHVNPPQLPDWSALFSQVVIADGGGYRIVVVSGQVGVDANQSLAGDGGFQAQLGQAFVNLATALEAAGSRFKEVAKLTLFVVGYTHDHSDLIAAELRKHFGADPRPALSLIGVQSLARPEFLVEVEALAIGDQPGRPRNSLQAPWPTE